MISSFVISCGCKYKNTKTYVIRKIYSSDFQPGVINNEKLRVGSKGAGDEMKIGTPDDLADFYAVNAARVSYFV